VLEAEFDARTPSPAQRTASRSQGRTLLRAGRAAWRLPPVPPAPHHPIALGIVAAAAGLTPADAALAAAYGVVTAPASAATRLLGLDPLAVTGLLARLAPAIERTATSATVDALAAAATTPATATADADADAETAGTAGGRPGEPRLLPAAAGIRLDLLAERHRRAAVRMFTS
jgi:urease accessory protein